MDPCVDFQTDIDIAVRVLDEETPSVGRLFLRVIGLDDLWDLIRGNKSVDWKVILDLLLVADIAAAVLKLIQIFKVAGLTGVAEKIATRIGPWALAIWAVVIVVELAGWLLERSRAQERFDAEVKRLYVGTDCPEKDAILKKKGIPLPVLP